jgi:hypothetical protein
MLKKKSSKIHNFLKHFQSQEEYSKADKQCTNVKKPVIPNYRLINDKEIENMYSERISRLKQTYSTFRSSENLLKSIDKDGITDNLPKSIINRLSSQEKCLVTSEKNLDIENTLSRNIGLKIHRSQEDLLMSRTSEMFRQKVENAQTRNVEKRLTVHEWIASLRRPKQYNGTRMVYINSGDKYNPKLIVVKDTVKQHVEYIRKPSFNQTTNFDSTQSSFRKLRLIRDDDRFKSLQVQCHLT